MNNHCAPAYENIAAEYYDLNRHPTCANFRELSAKFLAAKLNALPILASVLEVGAGSSLAAELLPSDYDLRRLTISDHSPAMLKHSEKWTEFGASLLLTDAEQLMNIPEKFDGIVASLADPYNTPKFWSGAFSALKENSFLFCTMPSYQWATSFRLKTGVNTQSAEFSTMHGLVVVPSLIPRLEKQVAMIENAGFFLKEFQSFGLDSIDGASVISQKLKTLDNQNLPLLWGFVCANPVISN